MRLWIGSVAVAVILTVLGGCASFGAVEFVKADESGMAGEEVALLAYSKTLAQQLSGRRERVPADAGLDAPAGKWCGMDTDSGGVKPKIAGSLVPIVAAVGQLGVNLYFEKQKQRIEEIVEASRASYGVTVPIKPDDLADTKCLLLVRYAVKPDGTVDKVGMHALIAMESIDLVPGANTRVLRFRPIYVRAYTAAAQTRKAEKPTLGLSVAVSLKAVGRQQSQIMRLLPTGEGVVSVANVELGAKGAAACDKNESECKSSDLVPYPTDRGLLSLSVAVAEQGITGFDDKVALAEIAALKEALGPAVSDAIKAKFAD